MFEVSVFEQLDQVAADESAGAGHEDGRHQRLPYCASM